MAQKRAAPGPTPHRHQKRRRFPTSILPQIEVRQSSHRVQETLTAAFTFFAADDERRTIASAAFPPEITSAHIRAAIGRFNDHIMTASKADVCSSCGKLVPTTVISYIDITDPIFQPLEGRLDHCGRHGDTWGVCSHCYAALPCEKISKFSGTNLVNVTFCHQYPSVLEDLTLTEECLIARCHPLGIILKLRPGGRLSSVSYYALRGHFIVIPENPGPLLRILPSPDLKLHDLIRVFWLGNRPPTDSDLKPFLVVRKAKVLAALQYLSRYNHLYHDLTINRQMMDDWSVDFILSTLRDSIIWLDDADHHEREGYTVNLETSNYENDLQAAEDNAGPDNALVMTGSVTTDINAERQNPDVRALDTLLGLVAERASHQRNPLISYTIRGRTTLLNHWDDSCYFTAAFPTLFPTGVGGHLDDRAVPVSLAAFAEWAVSHHSRRFARHRTFMYLLYDVLQLRASSLANSVIVKRHHWRSVTRDIDSLTADQLRNAAKELAARNTLENAVIRRLLRNMVTIGMQVPGSFYQKLKMRSEIRGIMVREGMPALWITINPSDLQNPLILILAGVRYASGSVPTATSAIHQAMATSNPAAVAQIFHHTCKAILDGLFAAKSDETGVLGDVSNYFGVVETNGRGMLHLHVLVWLRGNMQFPTLRDRLLKDTDFAARVIRYLETVIMQSIHENDTDEPERDLSRDLLFTDDPDSDSEFDVKLSYDSNHVACKKQVHSKQHSATCFNYRPRGSTTDTCRFGMPRDLVSESQIDDLGVIHLARNHACVNPWNPAMASCIRSNHDISWIPTVSKSLLRLYYITNYATKDDLSPWQMLTKAALLKQSIDKANATDSPTTTDLRLREKGMDSCALRCFNVLSHDQEVSGVRVASALLKLPTYYTVNYNFMRINLWWLRHYIRAIIQPDCPDSTGSSDPMGEETCTYEINDKAPVSLFDNYKLRGPDLASLSLCEYGMLVRTQSQRDAVGDDVDFDPAHPRHGTHMQRIARTQSQVATITFTGQLTDFQTAEDCIRGGHPTTAAIRNDIAEILLGLFVPWARLLPLFQQHATAFMTKRDACAQVWDTVQPTLTPHLQRFANNIALLRKSKEDCQADADLRKRSFRGSDSFDDNISEPELTDFDTDDDEPLQDIDETFNTGTLIAAFHSIYRLWSHETLATAQKISVFPPGSTFIPDFHFQNLQSLNVRNTWEWNTAGYQFFLPCTLRDWELRFKNRPSSTNEQSATRGTTSDFLELDDFNLQIEDGFLHPILADSDSIPALVDRRSQIGDSPTGASLTALIVEDIPLNTKQRLVVERILSEALAWSAHPYDYLKRRQTLLYIGGEGEVGKSQITKAIVAGMDLIDRKHEVILMAPTGAAADNIGGNTYHTSLGIPINQSQRNKIGSRIRNLWFRKTIMIVDEVSMMDLSMLSVIDSHCKAARSLDRNSTDCFGGVPVVILVGDFFQFPPVRGPPLWKAPRPGKDDEANGQLIWHRFKQVIFLDDQMRQAEDPLFRDLLARSRSASLTEDDLTLLNTKVITSLVDPRLQEDSTIVVKLNTLRHQVNRVQMEQFARSRGQKIFAHVSIHTRTKSTGPRNLQLQALFDIITLGPKHI